MDEEFDPTEAMKQRRKQLYKRQGESALKSLASELYGSVPKDHDTFINALVNHLVDLLHAAELANAGSINLRLAAESAVRIYEAER